VINLEKNFDKAPGEEFALHTG